MARTTIYVPDDLYRYWHEEAPDVVLSDFVRQGLEARRRSRRACVHLVATCASCGATASTGERAPGVNT